MRMIGAFKVGVDGSHRGLTDLYPEKLSALTRAIARHKPFTTGWYSSKHEVVSAKIESLDGHRVHVSVSVSDDFDTHGIAVQHAMNVTMDQLFDMVEKTWDLALEDQMENRTYRGYSLLHWTNTKRGARKHSSWVDTFLVSVSDLDEPSGDNYHWWGWENDEETRGIVCRQEGIPPHVVVKFAHHACSLNTDSLRIGDWEITSWEKNK